MAKTFTVVAYGALMTGERNGRWTADSLDRKTCVLRRTLYDMGWSYPTFIPNATNGKIKAELLTVTEAALARMDALEAYPRLYRHEAVQAVLADVSLEAAMVYVMNKLPRGAKVIADGDWLKFRAEKN